jgi:hypothetical protein
MNGLASLCSGSGKHAFHKPSDLLPVTCFQARELDDVIAGMQYNAEKSI